MVCWLRQCYLALGLQQVFQVVSEVVDDVLCACVCAVSPDLSFICVYNVESGCCRMLNDRPLYLLTWEPHILAGMQWW